MATVSQGSRKVPPGTKLPSLASTNRQFDSGYMKEVVSSSMALMVVPVPMALCHCTSLGGRTVIVRQLGSVVAQLAQTEKALAGHGGESASHRASSIWGIGRSNGLFREMGRSPAKIQEFNLSSSSLL